MKKYFLIAFVLLMLISPAVSPALAQTMMSDAPSSVIMDNTPPSSPLNPSSLPSIDTEFHGVCDRARFGCDTSSPLSVGGECNVNKDCAEIFSKIPGCDTIGPLGKCVIGGDPERIRRPCLVDTNCKGELPNIIPPPIVKTVVPSSITLTQPVTTVTIIGSNFTPESAVSINNGPVLPINMVQSTQKVLSVDVPRSAVLKEGALNIKVVNPGRNNEGVSNSKPIEVSKTRNTPAVAISKELKVGVEGTANALLNIRKTPSQTAEITGRLNSGDTARVIGGPVPSDNYIWWQISSGNVASGWVVEKSISIASGNDDNVFFANAKQPAQSGLLQSVSIEYWGACDKNTKKCVKGGFPLNCTQLTNGINTCLEPKAQSGECKDGKCIPKKGAMECVVIPGKLDTCYQPPKPEPRITTCTKDNKYCKIGGGGMPCTNALECNNTGHCEAGNSVCLPGNDPKSGIICQLGVSGICKIPNPNPKMQAYCEAAGVCTISALNPYNGLEKCGGPDDCKTEDIYKCDSESFQCVVGGDTGFKCDINQPCVPQCDDEGKCTMNGTGRICGAGLPLCKVSKGKCSESGKCVLNGSGDKVCSFDSDCPIPLKAKCGPDGSCYKGGTGKPCTSSAACGAFCEYKKDENGMSYLTGKCVIGGTGKPCGYPYNSVDANLTVVENCLDSTLGGFCSKKTEECVSKNDQNVDLTKPCKTQDACKKQGSGKTCSDSTMGSRCIQGGGGIGCEHDSECPYRPFNSIPPAGQNYSIRPF